MSGPLVSASAAFVAKNSRKPPFAIEQSLRFDGTAYLSRTPSTNGNRTTGTVSMWFKKSYIQKGLANQLSLLGFTSGSAPGLIRYRYQYDYIEHNAGVNGGSSFGMELAAEHRDPSAWMHFVWTFDYDNASTSERMRMYINGVRQATTTYNPPTASSGNTGTWNASGVLHQIGRQAPGEFQGYMAEIHNIDGQALEPTSFGEFDDSGVWRPIEVSGLTYGTNGFYLKFDPSATNGIGHDHSGNGNNWSPTGFTTSGAYTDVMDDTPTTNYATLNPLTGFRPNGATGRTYSDGNLVEYTPASPGKEHPLITTTQWLRSADGGVYQFEDTVTNSNAYITFAPWMETENAYGSGNAAFFSFYNYDGSGGTVSVGTGYGATGTVQEQGTSLSADDVLTTVVDFDNNTIAFYVNGTRNGYITGCNFSDRDIWSPGFAIATSGATATTHTTNFGQQAFQYTPVSGAKPWSTAELPAPDISDPSEHFQTVLDTGANILSSAQSTFSSGLWWIKDRANSNHHQLVDSVTGTSSVYRCPSSGRVTYSAPSGNSVAWCWALPSSSGTTDTSGSIDTTVYANTDAGFSIATWAGTGVNATVGHGLDFAPEFVGVTWSGDCVMQIGSSALASWTNFLELNTNYHGGSSTNRFQGTAPTDAFVSVGPSCNYSGNTMYMYSWHSVPGYSRIGKYAGNGNADGPFVYTGFKVGWLLLKALDSSGVWLIYDSKRDPYNFVDVQLRPSEQTGDNAAGVSYSLDFLGNGFKIRTSDSNFNTSTQKYLYMAFAENPMGGSGVSPAIAR